MTISKSLAFQHALCMDLKQDKFSFAIINKADKKIVDFDVFEDFEYSRAGVEKISSSEIFKYDYADYILTAGSIRNTLVPTSIFNHSKPAEIFQLNYSAPHDNLDYNRIAEHDIVNIYELPMWIKAAFVVRFPRVKMVHRATVLLKGILNQPSLSPKLHLFIEKDSFYFFITEKNKLQYFNRFDYKALADIVYHVLFVLEQKEISQDKIDFHLYGIAPEWQYAKEFRSFFKNEPKISEQSEQGEHFMLAKQLLCV